MDSLSELRIYTTGPQLKVLLLNKPVDIFSINETRLDDTISSEEIFLDMKYSEKTDQELVVVSFSI